VVVMVAAAAEVVAAAAAAAAALAQSQHRTVKQVKHRKRTAHNEDENITHT
jgi:hypothetical protein